MEEAGIDYHSSGEEGKDLLLWDESEHYELSAEEVDSIDDVTRELHGLCLGAVDHAVNGEQHLLTETLGLPEWMADYVIRSWRRGDPALMCRLDLAVSRDANDIRLIECNGDTPTLAIETAVAQWHWLQDTHPDADQFNSLHERLIEGFRRIALLTGGRGMHFAAYRSDGEEWAHSTYFRDLAEQAGIPTRPIDLGEVRWNEKAGEFRDEDENVIRFLQKLYPWEHIVEDEFGRHFARDGVGVVEPPWKIVLSHKGLLAVLWNLHEGHPNLLEARFGPAPATGDWVEKPVIGRGGANIRLVADGKPILATPGGYGDHSLVSQRRVVLPEQGGWHTMVGSWFAADEPCGIIFREGRTPVLGDGDRILPHLFRP